MQSTLWTSGAAPIKSTLYSGLLSRPLVNMSEAKNVSIILRGVKLRRNFLCDTLATPIDANSASLNSITEDDYVNLSNRARTAKLTSATTCFGCHQYINNLGVMTTQYDQLGRFITSERAYNSSLVFKATHTVDSSAAPQVSPNDTTLMSSLKEFSLNASDNLKAQQCFAKRSFQFLNLKNEDLAVDSCQLKEVTSLITTQQPLVNVFSQHLKNDNIFYKKIK